MMRAALILLSCLLLNACAQPAPDSSRPIAWLKPGVQITLQRPVIASNSFAFGGNTPV